MNTITVMFTSHITRESVSMYTDYSACDFRECKNSNGIHTDNCSNKK